MRDESKVQAIESDYTTAGLSPRELAIANYATELTRDPASVTLEGVTKLREAGLEDDEILDVCQVTAYYNFVNRMAQGLGVELEVHRDE
ncbi:MAG: peroxidase [Gemmatimonadota bacterium]|nr:MAG: peroxidase [Gemmatimonadota bacterium]